LTSKGVVFSFLFFFLFNPLSVLQVTTVQHKQMFVPNQELPSPALLDGAGQFAAAPPGGFLGSKRAGAMQQAVSRSASCSKHTS